MADAEGMGFILPTGDDYINKGDDAISVNAQKTADLIAALQAAIGLLSGLNLSALQFKSTTGMPADIGAWTGVERAGLYRVPAQSTVDGITGRPAGAGPGIIVVYPIGSTASIVRWVEFGEDARTWECTIATVDAQRGSWTRLPRPKHVGTSLTLTGGSAPIVRTDFGGRLPINLGVTVRKWRLHLRNGNLRDNAWYTGVLTITGLSIGEAAVDANGNYTGAWVDGTQKFLMGSATTRTDGGEFLTGWFDYTLDASKAYLLSYGIKGAAGQQVVEAQGGGFVLTAGSAALNTVAPAVTRSQTMPLDVWVEAVVPESTPVYGFIGDSLAAGVSSSLPVHDAWGAKYCRTVGALPVFWAGSGDTMANASNTLMWKFHQFDKMARPDAVYFAMGSNDLAGAGRTLDEMKTRFRASSAAYREFTSSNMVLCSIFPRLDPNAAFETLRQQYNEWLATELPGGASRFLDTAAVLTAPNGRQLDARWPASPTDIHLNSQGYARVATALAGNIPALDQKYTIDQSAGRTVKVWDYLNKREQLIYGDTGLRDVGSLVSVGSATSVYLRREGSMVHLVVRNWVPPVGGTGTEGFLTLPSGFRPVFALEGLVGTMPSTSPTTAKIYANVVNFITGGSSGGTLSATFATTDPWPTTLPGTAVGSIPS